MMSDDGAKQPNPVDVLVIGSGIIGLTTAVRLAESGRRVRIWAASPSSGTVSSVAAAIWYPFRAYPAERVATWGARSFTTFADDARDPSSGVVMREGRVLGSEGDESLGLDGVPAPVREIAASELPPKYTRGAITTVPVVEMPLYLAWLEQRFARVGGTIDVRRAQSLDEALSAAPVVVNCTGLGARELANDRTVVPIRGQVMVVENPGIERFTLDAGEHAEEVMYVIPRSRDVVLGGTASESWDERPDEESARRILARCASVEPALRHARVLRHAVGLRPGRPMVRVEREHAAGGAVIHNYGHGGSGVTVCWGCAEEVLGLV
jgi:D-amino-acid oxidase